MNTLIDKQNRMKAAQLESALATTKRAVSYAEDIREFLTDLLDDGYSLRYIAGWLNQRHCVTPQGARWCAGTVLRCIRRLGLTPAMSVGGKRAA